MSVDAIQILDDTDPMVAYSTGWEKGGSSDEYNETTTWTKQAGATATLIFEGIQVSVVGTIGHNATGLIPPQSNYVVDDSPPVSFSTSQGDTLYYNTKFYQSPILQDGQHKLVVTNVFDSNNFFIDYFLIGKSDNDTLFKVVTMTLTTASSDHTSQSAASTTGPSSSNTSAIVGLSSALGGAALVVVAFALILLIQGRNKRSKVKLIVARSEDDQESIQTWGRTPFPSDTSQPDNPFEFVPSDTQTHGTIPSIQHAHSRPHDALPPPPGYTVEPLSPLQGSSSENLFDSITSKLIRLTYNSRNASPRIS